MDTLVPINQSGKYIFARVARWATGVDSYLSHSFSFSMAKLLHKPVCSNLAQYCLSCGCPYEEKKINKFSFIPSQSTLKYRSKNRRVILNNCCHITPSQRAHGYIGPPLPLTVYAIYLLHSYGRYVFVFL